MGESITDGLKPVPFKAAAHTACLQLESMAAVANTIFSPELAARFDKLATIYPLKRSALVPMLLYAQDEVGYVSDEVVAELAVRLDLLELDVRSVLSYYSMLRTKPAGKYNVQVCTNISCMLRGGFELLQHCKDTLHIEHKGVTPDGLFSLEEVECIGACCWAPAVQVNYDFHESLTPDKMDTLLAVYAAGKGSNEPPRPSIGSSASAAPEAK